MMKLAPAVFWAMTLQEFQAAVRGSSGDFGQAMPMHRHELDALMEYFPDGAE